jgi:hypothetical protein
MLRDNERYCERCGQKLPGKSKMSRMTLAEDEARANGWSGDTNGDGTLTIDLCMGCQIERSERLKRPVA